MITIEYGTPYAASEAFLSAFEASGGLSENWSDLAAQSMRARLEDMSHEELGRLLAACRTLQGGIVSEALKRQQKEETPDGP